MEVRCEVEADGARKVTVSGEIDMATADRFQKDLLQAIDGAAGGEVVVELTGLLEVLTGAGLHDGTGPRV